MKVTNVIQEVMADEVLDKLTSQMAANAAVGLGLVLKDGIYKPVTTPYFVKNDKDPCDTCPCECELSNRRLLLTICCKTFVYHGWFVHFVPIPWRSLGIKSRDEYLDMDMPREKRGKINAHLLRRGLTVAMGDGLYRMVKAKHYSMTTPCKKCKVNCTKRGNEEVVEACWRMSCMSEALTYLKKVKPVEMGTKYGDTIYSPFSRRARNNPDKYTEKDKQEFTEAVNDGKLVLINGVVFKGCMSGDSFGVECRKCKYEPGKGKNKTVCEVCARACLEVHKYVHMKPLKWSEVYKQRKEVVTNKATEKQLEKLKHFINSKNSKR